MGKEHTCVTLYSGCPAAKPLQPGIGSGSSGMVTCQKHTHHDGAVRVRAQLQHQQPIRTP